MSLQIALVLYAKSHDIQILVIVAPCHAQWRSPESVDSKGLAVSRMSLQLALLLQPYQILFQMSITAAFRYTSFLTGVPAPARPADQSLEGSVLGTGLAQVLAIASMTSCSWIM